MKPQFIAKFFVCFLFEAFAKLPRTLKNIDLFFLLLFLQSYIFMARLCTRELFRIRPRRERKREIIEESNRKIKEQKREKDKYKERERGLKIATTIVMIDSITYSLCLCHYVQNGLSYSGEETRPKGRQANPGV